MDDETYMLFYDVLTRQDSKKYGIYLSQQVGRIEDSNSKLFLTVVSGQKKNRSGDQLTFRVALACHLIDENRKGCSASFQAKCVVPNDVRLASVRNHMLKTVSSYRRCRKSNRKGREKKSRYMCAECDVPLCNATCFSSFKGKKSSLN
ncbi:hypothetical protein TNCV_808221 [Trichonephila clavipes]|nr:hypothetical protein TNCV_808221 [Trichonephila clavipes]